MRYPLILIFLSFLLSCGNDDDSPDPSSDELSISYVHIGEKSLYSGENLDIPLNKLIEIRFNRPVDTVSVKESIEILDQGNNELESNFLFIDVNKVVRIDHPVFQENATYKLRISDHLKGESGETFPGVEYTFTTTVPPLILESILIDGEEVDPSTKILDKSRNPQIELVFNIAIDAIDVYTSSTFFSNGASVSYNITQVDEATLACEVLEALDGFAKNRFRILSSIENKVGKPFDGLDLEFYSGADTTYKFPEIPDEELLTLIQEQTFRYFWDLTNTESGLMRERYQPSNPNSINVTFGGSGFGVMAIIVGVERGFIIRQEAVDRWQQITDFLENEAATFHGVWPHWMNGNTGEVIPFSATDDGADLIETSFMIQGLLTVRQYLNPGDPREAEVIAAINRLWEAVEWDWFQQDGEDALTWHWSPNHGYSSLRIRGWNEGLIAYVLAASSPTHAVPVEAYTKGWAGNGNMVNSSGNSYYGFTLPLRTDMGGPLFFSHYSFLGLDPRNLSDQYADYWEQNVTHAKINHAYCVANPLRYVGYSDDCWGLTASDGTNGYSAHSPNNDRGVIAPTAAVASLPYTPEESMDAIRYFYYILGDRIWGDYGFLDAFDLTNNWVDSDHIAIDQGPQIIMIENHRTGLLWDLFMSAPEIQTGLTKLGFTY